MTTLKLIRASIPLMLVLVFSVCSVVGQKDRVTRMKLWSPPDKSFTLELPVNLVEVPKEYDDLSHENYKSIKLFGSSEADRSFPVFEVVILDLANEARGHANHKLEGLDFLIGGEDKRPTKETLTTVDGLRTREVLFVGPGKCSKGLIIDGVDRIYVLAVVVNKSEDLNSTVAKRFFKSFKLARHA